jgi:hypothetical protein
MNHHIVNPNTTQVRRAAYILVETLCAAAAGAALHGAAGSDVRRCKSRESWYWGLARRDRKGSLNDGQIQNPSNSFGIVPLSNFVPRGVGFVHHSIAILYH